MLRSPWLGVLAILIAGIVGYVMSEKAGGAARRLESVTVTVRATRDTGAGWDFGSGAPDPKVTVLQGDAVLATCEAKDTLTAVCPVELAIDAARGPVRVHVIDVDASDSDEIGELVLDLGARVTTGAGALQAVLVKQRGGDGGGRTWRRFRPLWIALAIGIGIATALARHRRRRA